MKAKKLIFNLFVALSTVVFASLAYGAPRGRYFDRAIYVIFENANYTDVIKQPFFHQLATEGTLFTDMLAITHPSQGNYIALTSGALNGVTNDQPKDIDVNNIIDLLEAKGLTWKVYTESYPGNCFTGATSGNYARKHNPFISYINIQKTPNRCANIVSADQFDRDVTNGTVPNYAFYIPDIKNDGHDTGVAYADRWYAQTFTKYLQNAKLMENTVLISTFDESGISTKNQIYTSLVGPNVKPSITVNSTLTIYSLLALMEDNWSLGNLGKSDVTAPKVPNIWRSRVFQNH